MGLNIDHWRRKPHLLPPKHGSSVTRLARVAASDEGVAVGTHDMFKTVAGNIHG